GIGYYPCLDSTRAEILSNCRKALVHAQMLPYPRIASFDSQTLTISGDRFYAHGDLPAACKEYGLALVLDPENTTARNSLGICLARLGQIDRAAAEFQEVLRLEPENCLARYNLGYVSLKTGNRKKGVASFRKCLELDPDHVFSLLRLGLLAEEEHDLEQAGTYYRQAITIPEGKKHAYRLLGKLAISKGELEQGRTSLQKALTHNPQDAETMHILARLYSEDGQDLEIAESLARKSSALRPERFDFVELLDSILRRQGKPEQARLLWGGRTWPAP
ncbi:MAG: tetratricopeptide repeat protein, partial [Thermodesulfobacteriota bacterium]